MTENWDLLVNAAAERIGGIVKVDYLKHFVINNVNQASEQLVVDVILCNEQRPHINIG